MINEEADLGVQDKGKNIALIKDALGVTCSQDSLLIIDPKRKRTINEDFVSGRVGRDELGRADDMMELNENVGSKNLHLAGDAVQARQPL